MKKKIALIMVMILSLFTFAGCTSNQQSFYTSLKAVSQWKYYDVKETGEVAIDIAGEKATLVFDATGYSNAEDMNAYVNMNMTIKAKDLALTLPNIQFYMLDGKYYISKNYFTALYGAMNQPMPKKFEAIKEEFIGITELGNGVEELYSMLGADAKTVTEKMYNLCESLVKDIDLNIPVEKKASTYTVTLKGDQLVDIVIASMDKGVSNLDSLNKTLNLKLTPEKIAEIKKEYPTQKAAMVAEIGKAKEMMKDCSIAYSFETGDKQYTQTINADFKVKDLGSMTMKINATAKQAEKRAITLPGKAAEMNMEQLVGLMMPKNIMIDVETGELVGGKDIAVAQVIDKNGMKYVALKPVMKAFGKTVVYDAKTKQVGVSQEKGITPVKGFVKGSTTYVSLEELKNLGLNAEYNKELRSIIITE